MSAPALLAGLLAAVCVALVLPRRSGLPGRLGGGPTRPPHPIARDRPLDVLTRAGAGPAGRGRTGRPAAGPGAAGPGVAGRLVAALPVGAGAALLVGGAAGVLLGAVAVPAVLVALGRLEPPGARRRRERLEADLPHVVDLLAACLASGRPPAMAVEQVAAAVGGPAAEELDVATVRLRLGVDPVTVWRDLGRHPQLGPLGRSLARAAESGASVAGAMARLAGDLRAESRSRMESRARAVGVRAALPLGVCLLPAFVLVGVVPLVAGSLGELLG